MHALVYKDNKLTFQSEYPTPERQPGEALVRVRLAGICSTDMEIMKGYMGFEGVPGHEFVGVVEACDDESLLGERVVGEINAGCGDCELCRSGMENHCAERTVLGILGRDGAFADYLTLPGKNLHIVPDSVADEEAVFSEPLAAAFEIPEQVNIKKSDRVCVLGDGRLGLLAAQVLSLTGCSLTLSGRHEEKMGLLGGRGIKTGASLEKKSFHIVIDCTGSESGLSEAFDLVRPRGTVVLKTTMAERSKVDLNRAVIDEISIVGSRCGPFVPALNFLKEGTVSVREMIDKTFPLEKGVEAFDYVREKRPLKVLIDMQA